MSVCVDCEHPGYLHDLETAACVVTGCHCGWPEGDM